MQTIIAAFDNHDISMRAVERLTQAGFDRNGVHVEHGSEDQGDAISGYGNSARPKNEGFLAGIEDFFGGLFGSASNGHSDAGTYTEAVRRGGHVVVVDAANDDEAGKAKELLYELGAIDVEERAVQWKKEGWKGGQNSVSTSSGNETELRPHTEDQSVMPIVQEEMKIGKRSVEGGGVRVVSRITETPVSELVRLRQERATIERRPVDRAATDADFANFKEGTVEVREVSEEAVVAKTARVVEEIVVGKKVSERSQTVTDTVRRTDVQVEQLDPTSTPTAPDAGATAGTFTSKETSSAASRDTGVAHGNVSGGSANRDPLTGAIGSHPVGTGIGAALGGAAAGAATGTVVGPVGTVIGAAVGAIAGGLAGKGIAEAIDPTREDAYWRENYSSRPYVSQGSKYDDYGPAYLYGVNAFSKNPNRKFEDVQADLGRDWNSSRGTSALDWDRARSATRDAWDKLGRSNG